jgi:DNA (cytosine-5)-methyltransferase 1
MRHLDLFSGIGGFAYAIDQVWDDVEHVFCDIEPFAQKVLKRHWPESKVYGDIRDIKEEIRVDVVTGGFPCQPFSAAGKRGGSEDDRFLWPEMLRVIQLTRPSWVVAENVGGIITIENGLVFEQACADLEVSGYAVQPIVLPALSVNATHRRDRVWIIAHDESQRGTERCVYSPANPEGQPKAYRQWDDLWIQPLGGNIVEFRQEDEPFICGVDDGVPDRVDRLKGLGNAIVPQVAMQIMLAIKETQYEP